jgi:hypothetical protein
LFSRKRATCSHGKQARSCKNKASGRNKKPCGQICQDRPEDKWNGLSENTEQAATQEGFKRSLKQAGKRSLKQAGHQAVISIAQKRKRTKENIQNVGKP